MGIQPSCETKAKDPLSWFMIPTDVRRYLLHPKSESCRMLCFAESGCCSTFLPSMVFIGQSECRTVVLLNFESACCVFSCTEKPWKSAGLFQNWSLDFTVLSLIGVSLPVGRKESLSSCLHAAFWGVHLRLYGGWNHPLQARNSGDSLHSPRRLHSEVLFSPTFWT